MALLTHFTGALTDDISVQVYEALAHHVSQANKNQRLKIVSAWSMQMTANAVLSALRGMVDPISEHLKEVYASELPLQATQAAAAV